MLWLGRRIGAGAGAGAGAGGANGGGAIALVRYFSRKRAENLRKINPRVSPQEASSIARNLYDVLKQHGPLTVSNAWLHAKDSGVSGLNSKTHMKLLLKWMRGRKMLKLWCNQVGSSKKFLLSTLPEDPKVEQLRREAEVKLQTKKPSSIKGRKQTR
ncbi:tumor necrosis factor receptor family protein [Parasponia andersonii]|uniref:Tumor necrosis factor receptor family protein n=1 Tax=Parasponia andersonii TaxID=3476 RepID=A0A2P5AVU8_PARAD|nr:tumor necrosis factor receptor family protein [Parasponia andersonii]